MTRNEDRYEAIQSRPASRRSSRWFQLTLRTALVVLTLACVWLGILTKRARDQRAAVARIEQLGGRIDYDWEYEYVERGQARPNAVRPGWPWLHRAVGPEYFQEVFFVRLYKSRATDADLRLIGKLRGVRMLSLSSPNVSDAGLHELRSWRLLHLDLDNCQITDEGIQHLRECAELKQLKSLDLSGTAVGDKTAQQLASEFPQLQHLDLSETRVTSQGIVHLAKLRNLRDLSFSNSAVDDAAVDELKQALPQCEIRR
jgi:hypothetical protein